MRRILGVLACGVLGASAAAQTQTEAPAAPPIAPPPVTMRTVPPPPPPPKPMGKARAAFPAGNPGAWATTADYPTAALREQREGNTAFRLTVQPDGRVSECLITGSSGSPDLDQATCSLVMRRAMFRPALDARGRPTQGSYSSRVRWVIPNMPKEPVAIEAVERVLTFDVESDGTTTNCTETRNGKAVPDSRVAALCASGYKVKPFTDLSGKAVRKRVVVTESITVSDPAK